MIEVYKENNKDYTHNGDMFLTPSKCTIKKVLDGDFCLDMNHPLDKEGRYSYLCVNDVISAPTPNGKQLFRIYNTEKNSTNIIVKADHISRDLKKSIIKKEPPCNNTAGDYLNSILPSRFKCVKSHRDTNYIEENIIGNTIWEWLEGEGDENGFGIGGDAVADYDNFNISLYRNSEYFFDKSIYATFGYNLKEITEYIDASEVYNRVYYKDSDNIISFNPNTDYVDSSDIDMNNIKEFMYWFSSNSLWDETEDYTDSEKKEQIRKYYAKFELNDRKNPIVNYKVDLVRLRNTVFYKKLGYDALENLTNLGDIVYCENKRNNISTSSRMISYEYDCIKKEFSTIELGDFIPNFCQLQSKYFKKLLGK